jgi:hypothetical protein
MAVRSASVERSGLRRAVITTCGRALIHNVATSLASNANPKVMSLSTANNVSSTRSMRVERDPSCKAS